MLEGGRNVGSARGVSSGIASLGSGGEGSVETFASGEIGLGPGRAGLGGDEAP